MPSAKIFLATAVVTLSIVMICQIFSDLKFRISIPLKDSEYLHDSELFETVRDIFIKISGINFIPCGFYLSEKFISLKDKTISSTLVVTNTINDLSKHAQLMDIIISNSISRIHGINVFSNKQLNEVVEYKGIRDFHFIHREFHNFLITAMSFNLKDVILHRIIFDKFISIKLLGELFNEKVIDELKYDERSVVFSQLPKYKEICKKRDHNMDCIYLPKNLIIYFKNSENTVPINLINVNFKISDESVLIDRFEYKISSLLLYDLEDNWVYVSKQTMKSKGSVVKTVEDLQGWMVSFVVLKRVEKNY